MNPEIVRAVDAFVELEQRVLDLLAWRQVWGMPTRASDVHPLAHYRIVDDVLWHLIQTARVRMNADSTLEPLTYRAHP